jgi:methoxymalonate biosynthesis acyl carrier protein
MEATMLIPETDTKTCIKAFLSQVIPDHELQDDEDIFAAGYVNSLFAMQLMLFIEKEFHITVEDEDMEIENFRTVGDMARLVGRKQQLLHGSLDRRAGREVG